jgi:hypothetical protein
LKWLLNVADVAGITARDAEDAEVAQRIELGRMGLIKGLAKKPEVDVVTLITQIRVSSRYLVQSRDS